jgi:hypothetical protein
MDRQAREREARKTKARIAELERAIAEKEQALRDLEHVMASPGFYADRAQSDAAAADHNRIQAEVAGLMREWESLQLALEANA